MQQYKFIFRCAKKSYLKIGSFRQTNFKCGIWAFWLSSINLILRHYEKEMVIVSREAVDFWASPVILFSNLSQINAWYILKVHLKLFIFYEIYILRYKLHIRKLVVIYIHSLIGRNLHNYSTHFFTSFWHTNRQRFFHYFWYLFIHNKNVANKFCGLVTLIKSKRNCRKCTFSSTCHFISMSWK